MGKEQCRRELLRTQDIKAVAGDNMVAQLEDLAKLSPSLSRYLRDYRFGNVLANATTGYREWSL